MQKSKQPLRPNRARKLTERHPLGTGMVVAALLFVIAGAVMLSLHAQRLETERDRALAGLDAVEARLQEERGHQPFPHLVVGIEPMTTWLTDKEA